MPRQAKNPGSRPGRRTKEEELLEFAAAAGVEPQKVGDFLGGALTVHEDEVPSAQEIRDRLLASLSMKLGSLQGIALVQALKAITVLAETEEAKEDAEDPDDNRRPLLDRVEALPAEHAAALIKQELARTDQYRADLFTALQKLETK